MASYDPSLRVDLEDWARVPRMSHTVMKDWTLAIANV